MFASIRGTKLYFDIEGSSYRIEGKKVINKPVCFLLHGGPGGNHTVYKPYLTPLTKYVQLVYIDNRGSGLSQKGDPSTYTLENNVEDIEALRKYLGLEKMILLGQSYGGMVAMSYAKKYQENLKGLLLLTTSPSHEFLDKAKKYIRNNGTEDQKKMAGLLWEGTFTSTEQLNEYYKVMTPLYSYTYQEGKEKERPEFAGQRSYEALNEGFGRFLREYDVRPELENVKTPALVIGGRHDWITAVEESEYIAKKLPDSEFVLFENSSHSIIKDEYDKFIAVVSDFFVKKLNL
ncbi:alpha/beta fold hydrolase [Bacillaceae bacterium Marseille-Q3522]|nr:alpha/beta fold hydrolase [Bacillaceae bacterium Marseille-Q3522]